MFRFTAFIELKLRVKPTRKHFEFRCIFTLKPLFQTYPCYLKDLRVRKYGYWGQRQVERASTMFMPSQKHESDKCSRTNCRPFILEQHGNRYDCEFKIPFPDTTKSSNCFHLNVTMCAGVPLLKTHVELLFTFLNVCKSR